MEYGADIAVLYAHLCLLFAAVVCVSFYRELITLTHNG
jgi:hypothetical protein